MTATDCTWSDVLSLTESFGRETDLSDYQNIDLEEIKKDKYSNVQHSCHVLIFTRVNETIFEFYEKKAIVLMQMRFDGYLGFPGGLVDPGETPVEALNRELKEENGWDVSKEDIVRIEESSLKAHEHGEEVLGVIRVPLYTMGDAYRGFPSFLRNNFAGNAKFQLIETLINLGIVNREYVLQALNARPKMIT